MRIGCIDIGGTYIKTGVFENGTLDKVRETPTCAGEGGMAVLRRVETLLRAMPGIQAVGVSTAGEVDAASGTIQLCDNIPGYTGMNPKTLLAQALGLPVAVENDVNAAAVAEHAYGAARGHSNFLMVSYGTGVGGAVFIQNALYHGSTSSAGEFGGLVTHPQQVRNEDRGSGTYERYASTTALVERVSQQFPHITSGRAVFAQLQDAAVRREVDGWIDEMSYGLVSLLHAFNPSAVVLGGGILREGYILQRLAQVMPGRIKPSFSGCALLPAQLGNEAGLMGAAWLAEHTV